MVYLQTDARRSEAVVMGPKVAEVQVDPRTVFRAAFEAHYRRLVGLASLLVDDEGQAEEVVQEAFAQCWLHWDRVRNRTEPIGYLRQTVINVARGRLRRVRSARNAGWRAQPPPVTVVDPVHAAEADETRAAVLTALEGLTDRQRECVILRYYGECSIEETAAALGISGGAVKSHCHRALATLHMSLEGLR